MRMPLLVLALVLFTVPAHANTLYTYTGHPFTTVTDGETSFSHPQFTTSDSVSFTLNLFTPLGTNLSNFAIHSPLASYSASNGVCSLTDGFILAPGFPPSFHFFFSFSVWTDSSGMIVNWNVRAADTSAPPTCTIATINSPLNPPSMVDGGTTEYDNDRSTFNSGSVSNSPGFWTVTEVPEMGPAGLLGIGVLGLIAARQRISAEGRPL